MKTLTARDATFPALGLGTWQMTGEECARSVADALAIGYRHVDTARMYDNHEQVGEGLRRAKVPREDVFLTTKLWMDDLSRDAVPAAVDRSLAELDVGYIDLLLIHWPNEEIPLEATLEAMLAMREKGNVRHIGLSNFTPSQVEAAVEIAPVVCNQVEYHPLLSQDDLLATLRSHDMALVAYSPLAHGRVPGHPLLEEIAGAHDRSAAQVALRWLLAQRGVGANPKASSREHLEDDFRVFEFDLSEEELERIHGLAERAGERTVDPEFAPTWER